MTDIERQEFLTYMESFIKKVENDKEMARDFLVRTGIYTKKGKLTAPYKHLHLPSIEA